ncbi:MAG: hypothetical protein NC218_00005, partial [Acetobacter sp.]|nr:hypothetical protein [Acetobacter sp.]
MRKLLMLAGIFTVLFCQSASAKYYYNRENKFIKEPPKSIFQPYIGIDIATSSTKFGNNTYMKKNNEDYFKDTNKSIRFIIGAKYKYIGLETYYQTAENGTKNHGNLENDNKLSRIQLNYASY